MAVTIGVGLTITVAVIGVPEHPLAAGVIMKVTVCAVLVVLVRVPLMSPLPLAGIPVTLLVLSRVQMNNVPETLPVNAIVEIGPEQTVCVTGLATTFGVGLTVSVKLIGVDGQPPGKNVLKA